jgi:hypothetical protein
MNISIRFDGLELAASTPVDAANLRHALGEALKVLSKNGPKGCTN